MCSAVLRRTWLMGFRSIPPHLAKSGRGGATTPRVRASPAPKTARAYCLTSSALIRPPGPEPGTAPISTPNSRATRRAEGAAGTKGCAPISVAGFNGTTTDEDAPTLADSVAKPSWGTGEGTSMVALSVSSSNTGWSWLTASPTETKILTKSPDLMFSPSSGSLNSVAMKNHIPLKHHISSKSDHTTLPLLKIVVRFECPEYDSLNASAGNSPFPILDSVKAPSAPLRKDRL